MAQNKSGKGAAPNKVGRPPRYTNPEDMQVIIDAYFKECEGKPLINESTGEPYFDKYGQPIIIGAQPPTVTGLALALGFNTRLALINYQGKPEFANTVMRAKARVERYAETRLFDKDGASGAKFSLANNFNGWRERQDVNLGGGDTPLEVNITVSD